MRQFVADASHEPAHPTDHPAWRLCRAPRRPGRGPRHRRCAATDSRRGDQDAPARRGPAHPHLPRPGHPPPGPVDVRRMLDDVASDLQVAQPERRVTVETAPGVRLVADEERLTQAVMALGTNAPRHTFGHRRGAAHGIRHRRRGGGRGERRRPRHPAGGAGAGLGPVRAGLAKGGPAAAPASGWPSSRASSPRTAGGMPRRRLPRAASPSASSCRPGAKQRALTAFPQVRALEPTGRGGIWNCSRAHLALVLRPAP